MSELECLQNNLSNARLKYDLNGFKRIMIHINRFVKVQRSRYHWDKIYIKWNDNPFAKEILDNSYAIPSRFRRCITFEKLSEIVLKYFSNENLNMTRDSRDRLIMMIDSEKYVAFSRDYGEFKIEYYPYSVELGTPIMDIGEQLKQYNHNIEKGLAWAQKCLQHAQKHYDNIQKKIAEYNEILKKENEHANV